MRFVKGIGLFFIYPLTMLAIGFYAGVETYRFFYPGQQWQAQAGPPAASTETPAENQREPAFTAVPAEAAGDGLHQRTVVTAEPEEALAVGAAPETLYVGTEYVLEETDILHKTVVETTWRLPDKYVGMNREQFLAALTAYEASPPLSELERGFVGLEVLSFSRERVVVQMNYSYIQPTDSFYLAAYDNKIRVYLEDKETVYIDTDISVDSLPDDVQQDIIQMLWVENEEELYNFLENYSS